MTKQKVKKCVVKYQYMPLLEDQRASLLEQLPAEYKPLIEQYLIAAKNSEDWLEYFPKGMEWLLKTSWADLAKAYAKENGLPYEETRQEPTPTIGNQILELAQRRHTATNALIPSQSGEPGEMKWGSGWEQVKEVDTASPEAILGAYRDATDRMLQTLTTTPITRDIVQKDWKTGQVSRHLTPQDVIKELTAHEQRHADMFRIVFDTLTAPFAPSYKLAWTTPKQK